MVCLCVIFEHDTWPTQKSEASQSRCGAKFAAIILLLVTYNYGCKYLFPLCNAGIYGDFVHKRRIIR
jgi:hypothetical protein